MEGAKVWLGLTLFLGCPHILLSHKDLSKFFIVIDVVVLGVVVLGMKVGDEVVWDVVVRKKNPEIDWGGSEGIMAGGNWSGQQFYWGYH